jgi:hypothetical protein
MTHTFPAAQYIVHLTRLQISDEASLFEKEDIILNLLGLSLWLLRSITMFTMELVEGGKKYIKIYTRLI